MTQGVILLFGALTSCIQGQGPAIVTVDGTAFVENPASFSTCNSDDGFGTEVTDPWIDGDLLMVPVGYGGGCEAHVFSLCWDHMWAESWPVQTGISLFHGGAPDYCEAYISETLTFDLTPLKTAYQHSYPDTEGWISIGFEGYGLEYTFK
jgi:hypothetical protein